MRAALMLCAIAIVSGCTVGPDYKRPSIDTPQAYRVDIKPAGELLNTPWWEQFGDPTLNELIRVALEENKDLRIAAARVEEFIGRYRATRAQLFPQVGLQLQGAKQSISKDSLPRLPIAIDRSFESWSLDLAVSWEIDLWGRLRRNTEAARSDLLSTEEGRRGVILSLVPAVAVSYVTLVDLDRQLEIAKRTAQARSEFYRLVKLRFSGGVVSEVELSSAESDYETALATIPQLEKQIEQQENALSVLLGRNPGPITRDRALDKLVLPQVPEGLPSELLERRPDLRSAEQTLISANARIGVAKAAFFPSISLTGVLGAASASLSGLFSGAARTWSYGGTISQPIFTGGSLVGQLAVAEAQQKQALLQYQKTIQTAFQDVNNALIDQVKTREQLAAQTRQLAALQGYARLARLRYTNGYTSYLEVTDAETKLFNAELQYAQAQGQLFSALINVYKAMGGGWIVEAEKLVSSMPQEPKDR